MHKNNIQSCDESNHIYIIRFNLFHLEMPYQKIDSTLKVKVKSEKINLSKYINIGVCQVNTFIPQLLKMQS